MFASVAPVTGDNILLSAKGLTKTFGDFTAVDGIDFGVRRGEAFGFLGPNGAGKSSTMRMGVEHGFVRKAGAWYTYDGDQLGQGKENARAFLRDNPDLTDELEKRIKEKLGIGAQVDAPAEDLPAVVPSDI